jgi:hypothetical protein
VAMDDDFEDVLKEFLNFPELIWGSGFPVELKAANEMLFVPTAEFLSFLFLLGFGASYL